MFWFCFWFFVGPALALAIFAFRGERDRAQFVAEHVEPSADASFPPASVIVPLNGPEDGLREKLAALAALDYPNYELIVSARTAAGIPPGVLPARVIVVLGGAKDQAASETIQNLLAGVRATRKRSEIFAFTGSGGGISANWLRALVLPLSDPGAGASTGFRWYLPEPPDFWSLMRSVWNAPIAGMLGPGGNPFAWAGAMAIRKETFFELRVPEVWNRALNAGGALAQTVSGAGLKIAFAPGAMVACSGRIGAHEFLRRAVREMALARVYFSHLWWGALGAHFFYCGAMAASIAASIRGSRGAEWALVAQLGLGMLKGVNRAAIAKVEFPDREAWFKRHSWMHAWWAPLATWLWLGVLLASVFTDQRRRK